MTDTDEHVVRADGIMDMGPAKDWRVIYGYGLRDAIATALRSTSDAADQWKDVALRAGVCPTCALGAQDTFGCSDCLNTGWAQGTPSGYVTEEYARQTSDAAEARGREYATRELTLIAMDAPIKIGNRLMEVRARSLPRLGPSVEGG